MRLLAVAVITLFAALPVSAQQKAASPDKAKAFLNKAIETLKAQKAIRAEFTYKLENTAEKLSQENKGTLEVQGNNYKMQYLGATKIYDGKKTYTIVPDNEEVTIESDSPDDSNTQTPFRMLDSYRTGYKYKWDILQAVPNRKIQYIELSPIKTNAETKRILVGIDNKSYELYTIIQIEKNGTKTIINIDKYTVLNELPPGLFFFDRALYEKKLNYYINEI